MSTLASTIPNSAWSERSRGITPPTLACIHGEFVGAASGKTFDNIRPDTGAVLSRVAQCAAEDVDRAVRSAAKAFESGVWSRANPFSRKVVLLRLADLILEHQEELALLEALDMGMVASTALTLDIPSASMTIRWYAEAIDKIYGELAPTDHDELAMVLREPLGVVGAVIPWNFPLGQASWKLGPALAAGNSVVLKPAEQSPSTALRLAELALEAGLPRGVLNVVPGLGEEAGRAIGLHPDVACLSFTGSTEVGKLFLKYSSESNMKQTWLECGGKSPNIVFADCEDLDRAAQAAALGIFSNQGEVCSANSRLVVERSIQDEFVGRVIAAAEKVRVGSPFDPETTMGPLVDVGHARRVMAYIDAARTDGRVLLGGDHVDVNGYESTFVAPTIIADLPNDHPVVQEEIFGPVLAVLPFDTEAEAVRIANASAYGLAASVWTEGLTRAHRLVRELHVGTVSVNKVDALGLTTPFGGFKESGFGRDLSLHAFDKYTGLKSAIFAL